MGASGVETSLNISLPASLCVYTVASLACGTPYPQWTYHYPKEILKESLLSTFLLPAITEISLVHSTIHAPATAALSRLPKMNFMLPYKLSRTFSGPHAVSRTYWACDPQ